MTAADDFPRLVAVARLWANEIGDEARKALAELDRLRADCARHKAYIADLRDSVEYLERVAVRP